MIATLILAAWVALSGCKDDGADTGGTGDGGGSDGGAAASPGDLLWLATGGGSADELCVSAIEAEDGTLVVACDTSGFTTWGEGQDGQVDLVSVGKTDALLLGLDPVDGSLLWHLPLGTEGYDTVQTAAMARLEDGRIGVILELGGPLSLPGGALDDVLPGDRVLLLFDGTGTIDAAVRLSSGAHFSNTFVASVSPTASGGLLVTQTLLGDATLLPGSPDEQLLEVNGDYQTVLVWLDAELQLEAAWTLGAADTGDVGEFGVVGLALPREAGGAVVAGWFLGSLTLGDAAPVTLVSNPAPDSGDAFVALLGADGEPEWAHALASGGEDQIWSLAQAADGSVAAAGYFNYTGSGDGQLSVPTCGGATLSGDADHNADAMVMSLGADGCPRWLHGVSSDAVDAFLHLDTFDDGGVVASGWAGAESTPGVDIDLRFSDGATVAAPGDGSVVVRYDADGSRAWDQAVGTSRNHGLQVLADGRVAVAGAFVSGAVYGAGQDGETAPLSAGGFDAVVAVFAP